MNTRRIFIGVGMSVSAAKLISRKIVQYDNLPVRWGQAENWRLNLTFAGHLDDVRLVELLRNIEESVRDVAMFDIVFDSIGLGPDDARPKMVWLRTITPQKELAELRTAIDCAIAPLTPAHAPSCPHITLGRIKQQAWREISPTPQITRTVSVVVPVEAVTVWESATIDGANTYVPLAEFPLANV